MSPDDPRDTLDEEINRVGDEILHRTLDNLRHHVENAVEKDPAKLAIMARTTWGTGDTKIGTLTRDRLADVILTLHTAVPFPIAPGVQEGLAASVRELNPERIPLLIMFILPAMENVVLQLCWCFYVPEGLSKGGQS